MSRKLLAAVLIVASAFAWPKHKGVVIYAQSVPVTVQYQWSPNPASENVVSYSVTLDGGAAVIVPAASCSATVCSTPVSVGSFGSHISTVLATNQQISTDGTSTQSSPVTSLTWSLSASPSKPTNPTVKK